MNALTHGLTTRVALDTLQRMNLLLQLCAQSLSDIE